MVVKEAMDVVVPGQAEIDHSLVTKLSRAVVGVVTQTYDTQRKIVLHPMPNGINVERWDTLPIPVEAISIIYNREDSRP